MAARLLATGLPGGVVGVLAVGWLPALPGPLVTAALAVGGALLVAWRRPLPCFAGGILLGAVLGIAHGMALLDHRLPEACVRAPVTVEGRVASLPRVSWLEDVRRQRFEFIPTRIAPGHCNGPRRLLLSYYGPELLRPGEHWGFEARLKRPWGLVNPGSFNMQAWFAQTGIDATGSAREEGATRLPGAPPAASLHHRIRARLSERIAGLPVSTDARAVLQAVTVADRSGIDADLWRLFQQYGINHLLVISGLHIGLVAGLGHVIGRLLSMAAQLARRLTLARMLPGAVALLLATAYTALAGFSLATVRALVMLACVVLASWCWRRAGAWRNLLLAAGVLLAVNPLAGLGSGFWLSFGAVACLLWLLCWQAGGALPRRWLTVHAFMSVAMLPLCGWWFGGFSQVSAAANLLLVPLLGVYVVPLALLGALCALFGSGLAETLWTWAAWPLDLLLPAGYELAEARPRWLYRSLAPGPLECLLALAAVGLSVLPGSTRLRLLVPVLLLPLLLFPRQAFTDGVGAVHVLFMDVGQGTSVLVYDRHHALLYDTGGGSASGSTIAGSVVLPLMRQRGIAQLDTLVISHGDSDHSAGLDDVLSALPVADLRGGADIAAAGRSEPCRAGESWRWAGSGITFRVLAPAGEQRLSANNGSCVLQLDIRGTRLLLAGDIDVDRERQLVRYWREELASEWLLAAHHGSGSSSAHAWLKTVKPRHVVYSYGYANHFGHPHPAVRDRVAGRGARAWHTARQGAVELVVYPDGSRRVIPHRSLQPRYWH